MMWGAIILLIIDRAVKQIAIQSHFFGDSALRSNLFFIFHTEQRLSQLLSIGALCIALVIAVFYWKSLDEAGKKKCILPFLFVFGGGMSNAIDRIVYGGVIDMFSFPGIAVFNLADAAIFIGSAWLIWIVWHQQSIRVRS